MTSTNQGQLEQWQGAEGDHWVLHADRHDRMLAPFADLLASRAQPGSGEQFLDVGCGCGATTIDASLCVGSAGRGLGVDLSPQMIEVAANRAELAAVDEWTRFRTADAQTADLGDRRWDLVLSRFGVMFFDSPVDAFVNIARSIRPGGRLVFCCWQPLEANEWMLIPGLAAAEHVPLPASVSGDLPGPFSMADPDRIGSILLASGFTDVGVEPFTTSMLIGGGGSIDDTLHYMVTSGSGRALLHGAPEPARRNAIDAVRRSFEDHHDDNGVRLGAAAWIVTAAIS